MSELSRRVIVAALAAPLSIGLIYVGGLPLAVLLSLLAAGCAWEFFRLARAAGLDPLDPLGVPLAGGVPLVVHAQAVGAFSSSLAGLATVVLVIASAVIWTRGVQRRPMGAAAATVFGVIYTGGMLSFGYALRYHSYAVGAAAGTALVAFPLILTWASDIGAFFVGRAIGGRKLIPAVSPGKTVAGALGGVVATVIVCWLYARFVLRPVGQLSLALWSTLLFGVAVSVAAQLGDLAESLFKREAGMKDSSRIIPGHGGLLDRLDSLFFVLPVSSVMLDQLLLPAPR